MFVRQSVGREMCLSVWKNPIRSPHPPAHSYHPEARIVLQRKSYVSSMCRKPAVAHRPTAKMIPVVFSIADPHRSTAQIADPYRTIETTDERFGNQRQSIERLATLLGDVHIHTAHSQRS